jgi:hypothetical protein
MLQSDQKQYWVWGAFVGFLIGISSALPFWLPMIGYTVVVGTVTLLQQRIWQVPVWLLLASTILGTIFIYGFEILYLWGTGISFDLIDVFNLLLLPSIVLNLVFVLPIYGIIGEVVKLLYPEKVEV